MKQRVSDVTAVATFLGILLFLASPASALQCYECTSEESWSDCQSTAVVKTCNVNDLNWILNEDKLPTQLVFIPSCMRISTEETVDGVKRYTYVRQCYARDSCAPAPFPLPFGVEMLSCDLCTKYLCNGASSVTIAFSSLILMVAAVMLQQ